MTQDEYDKMMVVKVLYQGMNWSYRRIGRVLSSSGKTIKSIYLRALDEINEDSGSNLPKSRKNIDLRYVGDTTSLEYIHGTIYHSVTGGGKRAGSGARGAQCSDG